MKVLCVYHDKCFDGLVAAWAVRKWATLYGHTVSFVAATYTDKRLEVPPGTDRVFIVDFSYPREEMIRLSDEAGRLGIKVLDHHKTAEEALRDLPFAQFDMNRSGAGMTWDHLMGDTQKRPWVVDYVEDRDLWRFRLTDSKAVNAFVDTAIKLVGSHEEKLASVDAVSNLSISEAKLAGSFIQAHIDQYVIAAAASAYTVEFEGYTVPVVNAQPMMISELLNHLVIGKPFAVGWCRGQKGEFKYSLRSTDEGVDVSAIAQKYGGGGHRNAAGFSLRALAAAFV